MAFPATAAGAALRNDSCLSQKYLWECSWLQIAELEAPLPPVAFPPTTSLSEVMPCAGSPAYYWVRPTPLISHKTNRHPKRTRRRIVVGGSGGPLTRAFAGSKPLLIASLRVPGLIVLTLIFGDEWQTDALSRIDNPSSILLHMSGTLSRILLT